MNNLLLGRAFESVYYQSRMTITSLEEYGGEVKFDFWDKATAKAIQEQMQTNWMKGLWKAEIVNGQVVSFTRIIPKFAA